MKILFLHLSDSHITKKDDHNTINPKAIVNSLSQLGSFDECVLVFSGDIVFSGKAEEYKVARGVLSSILKGINDKYFDGHKSIKTLIVPGNHDNNAKNPTRNQKDLTDLYKAKNIDGSYYEDLSELTDFYSFANERGCFKKNRCVEVSTIKFGNFCIKVNLINSAPLSILGSDNGDKGLHHIPLKELNHLDVDFHEHYTISIIHHSPEWFEDESKKELYLKINSNTDLLFVGHEHFGLNESKHVNGKPLEVSSGIALAGTDTEHGFNALILDTNEYSLVGYKYTYNGLIYKPSQEPVISRNDIIFRGKYKFTHCSEFRKKIMSDSESHKGEQYSKYFVFPTLVSKEIGAGTKEIKISTVDQFLTELRKHNHISIEGGQRAGKTTLAKYLCLYMSENYVPIFLDDANFVINKNEKVIRTAIAEQFSSATDYDEFVQLSKDKKVLIIDRSDRVNKNRLSDFLSEMSSQFKYIIIFTSIDWSFDIKEKALEEIKENGFEKYRISPFYFAKRQELIEKVCENCPEKKGEDIEGIVRRINDEITGQVKLFQLTPDFIRQYVNYYLNFSFIKTQNDKNVFSKVYEANITFQLSQHISEENVDEILVALDFVAYHIHFNKRYPLPVDEYAKAINEYNTTYDNDLKPKNILEIAKKANILKETEDDFGIEFCDENLLAYFSALHLNRTFNEGNADKDICYILDNICFGINGDIILFMSYISSNTKILSPILANLLELMSDWDELDIEGGNISFLNKKSSPITKLAAPTDADKKKRIADKDKMEKEIKEGKNTESNELYSYDEDEADSFNNKIAKGLSYLDLVAKILPSFRHILTGSDKKKVTEILYRYPNKLLYFMLKGIDVNFDEIVNEILAENPKTKSGLLATKDIVERSIQTQSMVVSLCVYHMIACTASVGKGIEELNKFDFSTNCNYMLQNLMMEGQNGSFHNFYAKTYKLMNHSSSDLIKRMVGLVVRQYYMDNPVRLVGDGAKMADDFFKNTDKKKLAVNQAIRNAEKK